MDWKYKHFNQQAVFSAPFKDVLEAARSVTANSLGEIDDTADGFVARGRSAWSVPMIATFRVASVPAGTQLNVELRVERAGMRGYMLWDVGGYYNAQIDKWFTAVSQRLGEQTLVSKSTASYRIQQGCLAGCVVWLVAGSCLGVAATALERGFSAQASGAVFGPFSIAAASLALVAGLVAYLYFAAPDGPVSKFIRERLPGAREKR